MHDSNYLYAMCNVQHNKIEIFIDMFITHVILQHANLALLNVHRFFLLFSVGIAILSRLCSAKYAILIVIENR